jgi:hypothetical protein
LAFLNILTKLFDKPPTKTAFVEHVLRHIRSLGWADPTYDESAFCVRSGDMSYGLENAFKQYVCEPRLERDAFLTRWFAALADITVVDTFEAIKPTLLPMLRRRDEAFLIAGPSTAKPAVTFLERPFSDDLVLAIVMDGRDSLVRANSEHFAGWGVDEATVWDVAMHNLRVKSADAWTETVPGVFVAAWGDAYDAARAVFGDLVRRAPIEGEPVVMMPERDALFVASRRDPTALEHMVRMAQIVYDEGGRTLSMQPLELRDDDTWVPFDMPGPMKDTIDERLAAALVQAYEWQEQIFMKAATEDIFLCPLALMQKDDVVCSRSTWTTVPTLLPKSDFIGFARAEGDYAMVPWDTAVAMVGPVPQEPGMWPPRYRVPPFPNDEQFAALKNVSILG